MSDEYNEATVALGLMVELAERLPKTAEWRQPWVKLAVKILDLTEEQANQLWRAIER